MLGRARLFSRFQVPLTLAAPFEDQPEGSAEEKECEGRGRGRERETETGEMGGRCVEEKRREVEEARLEAAKLKSGQCFSFISFLPFFKKKCE